MRLIQYLVGDTIATGIVRSPKEIECLQVTTSVYALAKEAIQNKLRLEDQVEQLRNGELLAYQNLIDEGQLLPPLLHPDPAHMLVAGTGLTHLGSADTRAAMHSKLQSDESELTDSMRMFRMGLEGGKPVAGEVGVQPEWFYKGDGDVVVAPGADIPTPGFGLDLGDEAEIVGLYINDDHGQAWRVGFALGNEYSDHKTEKINYLYLAHSKLRACAFGPELLLGELPAEVTGSSRIYRNGNLLWEAPFLSGEENMSHSIANLEYHHFKYEGFRKPGDVNVHFFGTGTLSFADGIEPKTGDVFELESAVFGRPLRNTLITRAVSGAEVKVL